MKTFKKIILGLLALFITSSVAGYVYFEIKFSPPKNNLLVSENNDTIPITWYANEVSPRAALLLPVKLKGIDAQFYMQFDSGSVSTLFYKAAITSIQAKFQSQIRTIDTTSNTIAANFSLGKIAIGSAAFKVIDYGHEINWSDNKAINIIGTIGTDFLEKKVAVVHFKNNYCYFGNGLPNKKLESSLFDFEFKKRKILIPSTINGTSYNVLYDTGTSAFELVTSRKIWNELALKNEKIRVEKSNSVGRTLQTFTTKSEKMVQFEKKSINLNEVTYIEGTTFIQNLLMKSSGMGGMIGNKIFKDKVLLLDCKNQKIGIVDAIE